MPTEIERLAFLIIRSGIEGAARQLPDRMEIILDEPNRIRVRFKDVPGAVHTKYIDFSATEANT